MTKIFASPGKYIQGKGELLNLANHISKYGKKALILITESGFKRVGDLITKSFENSSCEYEICYFKGECSKFEIDRVIGETKRQECDIVVGIGGGKIADTVKAAAFYTKYPVVVCPTVASTDAPCSALSVLYTEEGVFDKYLFLPSNPDIVLIDTEVIAKSPVRLTVSGIGDALATYFEARACRMSDADTCVGAKITEAAYALAKLCFKTLMAEGVKAKVALEAGAVTESVEKIIEANTLLSGIGFESGGLAGAHAIHNGLTVIEECHSKYHGEKVAFGTLVQLVLENISEDELEDIVMFCIEIGLPVTLEQLGINDVSKERLMEVAVLACDENDTMGNMPFSVTPEKLCDAIIAADAIGKYFLQFS